TLWRSGTAGNPGAYLQLKNDGALVVRSASGTALWSGHHLRPPPQDCGVLREGEALGNRSIFESCDGRFSLMTFMPWWPVSVEEQSAVLQLIHWTEIAPGSLSGQAIWSIDISNVADPHAMYMQGDGNF